MSRQSKQKKSRSGNFLQSREQLSLICSKQLFSVLFTLYSLCSNFSFLFPAWSKGQIRSGHASRSCNTMLCYYSKTPQIAILIQDVLRMAPKCNNIFNAKCNNLSYIYSGRYSGRQSVDSRSIVGRQSVDSRSIVSRQLVDSQSIVGQTIGRVSAFICFITPSSGLCGDHKLNLYISALKTEIVLCLISY